MPSSYLDSQGIYVDKDAMIGLSAVLVTVADTLALTTEDSNKVIFATKTSATQVFTLPAVTNAGATYTFVAESAAGEILINPTGSVQIFLKASEGGASVATVAGTGCKNTAATNVIGDRITLVSDGTAWWATMQSGIWASQ